MKNGYQFRGKGYQVMELSQLDSLFADPKYFDIAIAIFHWLIKELREELKGQIDNIQVDIIRVEYIGAYPTLGIHYENPNETPDMEPLIETAINQLLRERTVIELISFIAQSEINWRDVTAKLMSTVE